MQIKSLLGLAGVASLGFGIIVPHAQAQSQAPLLLAAGHDDHTIEDLFYDLEYDNLEREGFICVNNPSEECGSLPYTPDADHTIPDPDYDVEKPSGFACVNNVNPACHNPRHYGVYFDEREVEVVERNFERTTTTRPAPAPAPAPRVTPTPAPRPAPAPIQGLW